MTECERIINKGILPKDFQNAEIICDYYVSTEQKKTWIVIYDLLLEFDRICREHGLRYTLAFGSLLGVVRHNGFIPWDDDIDVCMPRADYEKLIELKSSFSEPYFLQIPGKDNDYWYSFIKLRNSNTSAVNRTFRYAEFNQGHFLDIFPLDNCLPDEIEENAAKIKVLLQENSANMRRSNPYPSDADRQRLSLFNERQPLLVQSEIEHIARKYENEDCEWCTTAVMTIYKPNQLTFRKSDIFNTQEVCLYGHNIPIPNNYDIILKSTYGDYMKYPPVEKRGIWHSDFVFNSDISYKEILSKLREEDRLLYI